VEFWAATAQKPIFGGWRLKHRKNSCRRHSGSFANNAKKHDFGQKYGKFGFLALFIG